MKKHIVIKKKDNEKLYQEIFKRVKNQYDWAMKQSAECHFPWMPYFKQYFISNMEKPKFHSEKTKDKLYIRALRELKILPNEGEPIPEYMYDAYETKYGEKLKESM